MGVDLDPLRARVPDSERARLPAGNEVEAWLEVLGDSLGELLLELGNDDFENALEQLERQGADAVPALRAAEQVADRARRKSVRRVLHRLRSRGIDVGTVRRSGPRSALRPAAREAGHAFSTFIDPEGQRLVFLVVPVRGGARVYELLLSDRRGILQLDRVEGTRRDARRLERDLRRGDGSFEVPVGAALALIAEARAREGGVAAGVDPVALAQLLSEAKSDGRLPGTLARERLAGRDLPDQRAETVLRERLESGRLAPWLPANLIIEDARREVGQAREGMLVLSEVQRRERDRTVLARHAERAFDRETRTRVARRLEESAWGLLDRRDEEGALAALCAADRVHGGDDAVDVPLLRFLFEYALRQTPEPERSEGGLILPSR